MVRLQYGKDQSSVPKCGCYLVQTDGTVIFGEIVVVPKEGDLREIIMKEAHDSKLSIHPSSTKMYQDLKQTFLVDSYEA